MKPPNFRQNKSCPDCTYCKCFWVCGGPEEYECTKYGDIYVDEYQICDDYTEINLN